MAAQRSWIPSALSVILVVALLQLASLPVLAPRVAPSGPTSAAGSRGPSSGLPTTVSVAQHSPAWNVSASTLGVNLDGNHPWNATVASLINGTTTRYLRFPGSACAEGLNWTSGATYGNRCSTNPITITVADFVTDCNEVHCHAIMQMPTEIDSPSTAAYYVNWLEHTEHFSPAYYELGSEPTQWPHFGCPWSTWATTCASGTNATPATYPPVVKAYVTAIRATGSTVPILGLGGTGKTIVRVDGGTPGSGYAWAEAIYKAVGNSIQGLSVHDYPGRYNTTNSSAGFYANLVSNDPLLPNVQEARAGILAGCPTCTGAQILMTEGAIYSCHSCNEAYTNAFPNALAVGAFVTESINYGLANFDLEALYNGGLSGNWMGPSTPEPVYYLYSDVLSHMPLSDPSSNLLNVTQSGGPRMMWFTGTYTSPDEWTVLALNLNVTSAASLAIAGLPDTGSFTFYRWNGSSAQPVESTGSSLGSVTLGPQSLLLVTVNTPRPPPPTVPPAPTGLTAVARSSTSLTWRWTQAAGGGIVNNTVDRYRDADCTGAPVITSTGGAGTSLESASLAASTIYSATVTAWNTTGQSPASSCQSATTLSSGSPPTFVPPAPTGLSGLARSSSAITWSWTQSVGGGIVNNTAYLYLGASCAGIGAVASSGAAAVSFTSDALSANTTYSATVTSWNSTGQSPASSCQSATTLTTGTPPPSVGGSKTSGGSFLEALEILGIVGALAAASYVVLRVRRRDRLRPNGPQ
ncbi:MAG: hypothetical protein ACREDK_04715 [Thermoplasmata archaeon]